MAENEQETPPVNAAAFAGLAFAVVRFSSLPLMVLGYAGAFTVAAFWK